MTAEACMKPVPALAAALAMSLTMLCVNDVRAAEASASMQAPLCDPCVPPALRNATPAPQTEGAALQAQVERKLRESFEAADVTHTGTLTREQARAGGLGAVANNFDQIDTAKAGKVTFEDVTRYLRARGGKF
jgi:hypothetical protein